MFDKGRIENLQNFLKFGKSTSDYITKLSTYARLNYEIFENLGAMLIFIMQLCKNYANLKHYIGPKFNANVIKATHRRSDFSDTVVT